MTAAVTTPLQDGLSRSMATGAAWMVLVRLIDRGVGLVSMLILARILTPEDFGLVAMAMAIVAVIELLSTFSFDLALIQNARAERRHYDTAWTLEVIFGCVNAVVFAVLALPAAAFYGDPRVASVMYCLSATVLVRGFTNIGVVAFQKELTFHLQFRMDVTKRLIGFFVTIPLAYMLRSYWALLAGQFAIVASGVLLSYGMHRYRPRFSLAGRKELFHFSKWMLINNVMIGLCHRAGDFIVGRFSGAGALGLYNIAYEIANLPTTELVSPIGRAVFPGYALMSQRTEDLRKGFIDVLSVILIVVFPLGAGITVLAEPLVHVLLGDKWSQAVPLIQVLGVFGILRASASNTGAVYLAIGRPRLIAGLTIVYLAILLPGLIWLVPQQGAFGAAVAALIAVGIQVPLGFCVVMRVIGLPAATLAAAVWRPLAAGVLMGLAVHIAGAGWFGAGDRAAHVWKLLALVPLGAVTYTAALLLFWRASSSPRGGESILLGVLRSLRGRFNLRVGGSGVAG